MAQLAEISLFVRNEYENKNTIIWNASRSGAQPGSRLQMPRSRLNGLAENKLRMVLKQTTHRWDDSDEELTAIGVRPSIRHAQCVRAVVA